MKISPKQLDQLIESLVEQAFNTRFASSNPYKKTQKDKDVSKLYKYLSTPNLFFHFSETGKIGINPQSTDHPGVRGFYGFLLDESFFNQELHEDHDWFTARKKIIIFKVKPEAKILQLKNTEHLNELLFALQQKEGLPPRKRHQFSKAEQTKLLQKAGYDGLFSKRMMMTDIDNELVVFPPYEDKIEVVEILDNPFHKLKQNRAFFDPSFDSTDPEPEVKVPSKYKSGEQPTGNRGRNLPPYKNGSKKRARART